MEAFKILKIFVNNIVLTILIKLENYIKAYKLSQGLEMAIF